MPNFEDEIYLRGVEYNTRERRVIILRKKMGIRDKLVSEKQGKSTELAEGSTLRLKCARK